MLRDRPPPVKGSFNVNLSLNLNLNLNLNFTDLTNLLDPSPLDPLYAH